MDKRCATRMTFSSDGGYIHKNVCVLFFFLSSLSLLLHQKGTWMLFTILIARWSSNGLGKRTSRRFWFCSVVVIPAVRARVCVCFCRGRYDTTIRISLLDTACAHSDGAVCTLYAVEMDGPSFFSDGPKMSDERNSSFLSSGFPFIVI